MPSLPTLVLAVFALAIFGLQEFRVNVTAVEVDAFVGRGGKAILGLTPADFELYDDDSLQTIERIETQGLPVRVILALDTSHSVQGKKLEHLKSAARALLEALEPEDGAAVVTFSCVVEGTVAFDGPLDPLFSAVEKARSCGSTALNDGVFAALKLSEGVDHPMIVVFTDGDDRFSWLDGDQVLETAGISEAPIFVVTPRSDQGSLRLNRALLRHLSDLSGGELYEARSTGELADIFREVLAKAKTRYVLTFVPTDPKPGWHSLRIKLKTRRAEVRARRGYYYRPR